MDEAALQKCRKYKKAREKAGWDFRPFTADIFGALRSDARTFVSSVNHRKAGTFAPMEPHEVGQAVWNAVNGAEVQGRQPNLVEWLFWTVLWTCR